MDTGRLRMDKYRGVLYCQAYLDTEYTADDIQAMIDFIHSFFSPPADVILEKIGSYSLSSEAQIMLWNGVDEFRNFVYVVDNDIKRNIAQHAITTYMRRYNTQIVRTKEDAYTLLKELI